MSEKKSRRSRLFIFEILAIFIGITASFWVEEWREERQDTEIFHRILGEIFYNAMMDDWQMASNAAANNLALLQAGDLVLRDKPLPPANELFHQLNRIFSGIPNTPSRGGWERLTNTPLSIPVNDMQLALDDMYGALDITGDSIAEMSSAISEIAREHWWSRGVIPCPAIDTIVPAQPIIVERLDLLAQAQPSIDAVFDEDVCLPEPRNLEITQQAMESEEFRTAIMSVIQIRQNAGNTLMGGRLFIEFLRAHLVAYLPDIGLPVESVHILGSATEVDWNFWEAIPLEQASTNELLGEVTLGEGSIKFLANSEWTINWGAKAPWVASGASGDGMFSASNLDEEKVFPASVAQLNGMDIPVQPGRYRVRFNTQTFEYSFEKLD